jgi:N-methylhydantoinase A
MVDGSMAVSAASTPEGAVAGVDVGGTFTDLVLIEPGTGRVRLAKTPSTPDNQARGALTALDMAGIDAAALALVVHGTTVTTNAVLERRLSKTGLITTQGFRDVLELGRRTRPQPYGMKGVLRPIVPRDLRIEIPERMDAQGRPLIPLDEDALREAVETLRDVGLRGAGDPFPARLRQPGP